MCLGSSLSHESNERFSRCYFYTPRIPNDIKFIYQKSDVTKATYTCTCVHTWLRPSHSHRIRTILRRRFETVFFLFLLTGITVTQLSSGRTRFIFLSRIWLQYHLPLPFTRAWRNVSVHIQVRPQTPPDSQRERIPLGRLILVQCWVVP